MKKIFKFFLFLSIIFFTKTYAYDIDKLVCNNDYLRKLELCNQAIFAWSYKSLDFMCIQTKQELQLFQIVLDDHFKKIDKEIKEELNFLDTNKDYYFRDKEDTPSFLDWINDIEDNFWVYWKYYEKYRKACFNGINKDFAACVWEIPKKWSDAISFETMVHSYDDICFWLAKTKLEIYKNLAFELLILDKISLRKDNRIWFSQDLRKAYSSLARLMDININLLEKILFKWTIRIKQWYN